MVLFLARAKVFLLSEESRLAASQRYMIKHNTAQTTAMEDLHTT